MFTTIITTTQLSELLEKENLIIIDCRFHDLDKEAAIKAYQAAHIPKAVYAHLDEDLSGEIIAGKTGRHPLPKLVDIYETFSQWGIDKNKQVVVYDAKAGAIAARLWWMLRWLGHDNVAVLDGGWGAWEAEGKIVSDELHTPKRTTFTAKPDHDKWVGVDFVYAIATQENYKLIDSRAAVRYRGEHEPIDPIAGHIPGAISAPFEENWNADKTLLSKEELAERFKAILGDTPVEKAVFYCGSGVTACHNLLALQHAGLGDAVLYPGSWSDWITDEERPIMTAAMDEEE